MGSMRLNRTLNTLKKREQGFTLVELIAVVAIIAMIAIYVTIEINQSTDDAKVGLATAFLASNVPGAISSYRSRNLGSCRDINNDEGASEEKLPALPENDTSGVIKQRLVKRGLAARTPWDDIWKVEYSGETKLITLTYPIKGSKADLIAEDLAANLTGTGQVEEVTEKSAENFTVTYSCS
ncbi:MAG: type II secretion system protein [Ketobacter sp.]|nr:MAG: type II secretion system protein [Ketobacter sp.]